MMKIQAHRMNSKLKIKSKENMELIQKHKMDKFMEQNFMLNALKQTRDKDIEEKSNSIDENEYLKFLDQNDDDIIKVKDHHELEHRWIISYYSPLIRKWDFITCILVLYDCFMVPFKNTFGQKNFTHPSIDASNIFSKQTNSILLYVDFCIKLVFAADVILGFRKAYINDKTGQQVS